MRWAFTLFLTAAACSAAIGDNAPTVPAAYVVSHPRLGAPDDAYLANVWAQRANTSTATGAKRMFDAADAFDPTNPVGSLAMQNCRYLVIAYRASVIGGSPNAGYLTKIKALSD